MTFDRKEHKTKIGDVFKSFGGVFKALFGKQRENKMLRDLAIEKGFLPGLRYVLYLTFVLPFRLLAWVLTPSWAWVHFVQRHVITPLFEVAFIAGDESPSKILGGIFEKNLNHIQTMELTGVEEKSLKPEISVLERLVMFAKLRVFLTLFIFAGGALLIWGGLHEFFKDTGFIAGATSFLGFQVHSDPFGLSGADAAGGLFGGLITGFIVGYAIILIGAAFIAYLLIFMLRFLVESVKSLMFADREMLIDFIDDTLHYTIAKAVDLYGEDVAFSAYDLVLENVVIDRTRYVMDEPHYKLLEDLRKRRRNEKKKEEEKNDEG